MAAVVFECKCGAYVPPVECDMQCHIPNWFTIDAHLVRPIEPRLLAQLEVGRVRDALTSDAQTRRLEQLRRIAHRVAAADLVDIGPQRCVAISRSRSRWGAW